MAIEAYSRTAARRRATETEAWGVAHLGARGGGDG
jgi:hypothetical protein